MNSKWLSRKFIVTVVVGLATILLPMAYHKMGISEAVTLAVLVILGGIGTAYGVINVKDAQLDRQAPHVPTLVLASEDEKEGA